MEEHWARLAACRDCPRVEGLPVSGVVPGARVLLVGQAPGPREAGEGRPFAYTAGTALFRWFGRLGVTEEQFRASVYIAAVIRCFPGKDPKAGGDRVPDAEEIARCARHLEAEFRLLKPELVIAVGTLSAQQFLPAAPLNELVGPLRRIERFGRRCDLAVLPHPSGRSTWLNRPEHAALLDAALGSLAEHRAWKATFPSAGRR